MRNVSRFPSNSHDFGRGTLWLLSSTTVFCSNVLAFVDCIFRPTSTQKAVDFLHFHLSAAGIACVVKEYVPGKPILVATIPGSQPWLL